MVVSLWRRDRILMDSYRVSMVDVPESPIASCARGPDRTAQESSHLPFRTGPTMSVRLHIGAFATPWKSDGVSNALQNCGNPECRADSGVQIYDILRLPC